MNIWITVKILKKRLYQEDKISILINYDYKHTQEVGNAFGKKSYDLYVQVNTFLLANILKIFEKHALRCVTLTPNIFILHLNQHGSQPKKWVELN